MVMAASSILPARWASSARLPLWRLLALPGSFTPSMANISRPIRPWASQIKSTCWNTAAMGSARRETKRATVVKCGASCPHRAMKVTWRSQAEAMARLETRPRE